MNRDSPGVEPLLTETRFIYKESSVCVCASHENLDECTCSTAGAFYGVHVDIKSPMKKPSESTFEITIWKRSGFMKFYEYRNYAWEFRLDPFIDSEIIHKKVHISRRLPHDNDFITLVDDLVSQNAQVSLVMSKFTVEDYMNEFYHILAQ